MLIDIHCHILPGIDDGPSDMATSIEMLRIAAGDGITHIVATPHFRYGEDPSAEEIRRHCGLLEERITDTDIPVTLLSGADIRLTYELLRGLGQEDLPTINRSRYFLLELPDLIPPGLVDFIRGAVLKGLVPVITHPERNYSILSRPDRIRELKEAGALVQLTALSITGGFGREAQKVSRRFLEKGLADFVATDAHGVNRRVPVLSAARKEVASILGETGAGKIFSDNPGAVLEDREIGRLPEC